MTFMLKPGFQIVNQRKFGVYLDGMVQPKEAKWGEYLMTYENDHLEVMGFQPGHNPANVFNLLADNARLHEIRKSKSLRFEWGVDKL
mmetsp:Transcript_33056/g.50691  ORF Transcript_33056/g.50691 Transcript_33056/m.50691 type:complete len:87 (+) Transcript_33056:606-866(+)